MTEIIKFKINEVQPEKDKIFKEIGYSSIQKIPEKIQNLYEESLKIFRETSNPVGIISEISKEEFEKVFFVEGNNSAETPIQNIYRKADYLSLFAVTLGKKVSDKIREFFRKNDFALGHLLDCIASLAADNMVRKLENLNTENLGILYQQLPRLKHRNHRKDIRTLAYSPGYCGWHISGQKKLFEFLKPEKIGITLNDSFLMIPLKSISGVLISGKREIHQFKNNFSFCSMCKTKSCLERM
ncbi:MAG TPA: hypothetical protein ENL20_11535 [Candidatus Cloacimonetes bacterium]|nr:hypothetical protein [Candidatus Cloacimonadota bacterium]